MTEAGPLARDRSPDRKVPGAGTRSPHHGPMASLPLKKGKVQSELDRRTSTQLLSQNKELTSTGNIKMLFRTSVLRCLIQRRDCSAREQSDPIFTKQEFSQCTVCFQNIQGYSKISSRGNDAPSGRKRGGSLRSFTEGQKSCQESCTRAMNVSFWGRPAWGRGTAGGAALPTGDLSLSCMCTAGQNASEMTYPQTRGTGLGAGK